MAYNEGKIIMATYRSSYLFHSECDYQNAREHLYRCMSNDWNDSDKIYDYGFWGSCAEFDWDQCYRIDIYSYCSNVELASSIMREHSGRFYFAR